MMCSAAVVFFLLLLRHAGGGQGVCVFLFLLLLRFSCCCCFLMLPWTVVARHKKEGWGVGGTDPPICKPNSLSLWQRSHEVM